MAETPAPGPKTQLRTSGGATAASRRIASDPAEPSRPHPPLPSATVRLTAEVDRLEAELDTMRRRLAELEATAERDPLTGVLNRRGFERELTRALAYLARYPASAQLVYIDLDRFKPINDTHGHAAGDAMLTAVAARLTQHVRASDGVARLGGDEFAVLLWNLSDTDAHAKAVALEDAVASAVLSWQGVAVSVRASAGVAALADGDSAAAVMARADAAMYARKHARSS